MADNTDAEGFPAEPPKQRSRSPSLGFLVVVGVLFAAVFLASVDLRPPRGERRSRCINQLKQLSLAMLQYEADYKRFPPAYVADAKGRPLYSWRVLLLPYLDRKDMYDALRRDEPWDSPHNRSVLQGAAVAKLFQCPSAENPKDETSYVVIVGQDTISNGPRSVGIDYICTKDGTSATIMIAEIKNSGIHWAEPRDLNFEHMSFRINDPDGRGISSGHPGIACVSFCDGHQEFLSAELDPKLVKALTTINGGEDVSEFHSR